MMVRFLHPYPPIATDLGCLKHTERMIWSSLYYIHFRFWSKDNKRRGRTRNIFNLDKQNKRFTRYTSCGHIKDQEPRLTPHVLRARPKPTDLDCLTLIDWRTSSEVTGEPAPLFLVSEPHIHWRLSLHYGSSGYGERHWTY